MRELLQAWLLPYLGVGVLCLVALHFINWVLGRHSEPDIFQILREVQHPQGNDKFQRQRAFLLGCVVIPVIWPVVLLGGVFVAFLKLTDRDKPLDLHALQDGHLDHCQQPAPPPKFVATPSALVQRVSVSLAAQANIIHADGVPALPFGHLNHAWQLFVARIQDGDALWSFQVSHPTDDGHATAPSVTQGFALLRQGQIADEFIYAFG